MCTPVRVAALVLLLPAVLGAVPGSTEEIISNYVWADGRRYDYASCVDLGDVLLGPAAGEGEDVRSFTWSHSLPVLLGHPDLKFTRALLVFEAVYRHPGDVFRGKVGNQRFHWSAPSGGKKVMTLLALPSPKEHPSFWRGGSIDVTLFASAEAPDGYRIKDAKLLLQYEEVPDPVLDPALRTDVAMLAE